MGGPSDQLDAAIASLRREETANARWGDELLAAKFLREYGGTVPVKIVKKRIPRGRGKKGREEKMEENSREESNAEVETAEAGVVEIDIVEGGEMVMEGDEKEEPMKPEEVVRIEGGERILDEEGEKLEEDEEEKRLEEHVKIDEEGVEIPGKKNLRRIARRKKKAGATKGEENRKRKRNEEITDEERKITGLKSSKRGKGKEEETSELSTERKVRKANHRAMDGKSVLGAYWRSVKFVTPPSPSCIQYPSKKEFESAIDIMAAGKCPHTLSVKSMQDLLNGEWLGTDVSNFSFFFVLFLTVSLRI